MSTTLEHFLVDELAFSTWQSKYQIKDKNKVPQEETPDDMHWRLAKEFSKAHNRYVKNYRPYHYHSLSDYGKIRVDNPMTEEYIYNRFKNFGEIVPQGSIMDMLGNPYKIGSLSNCFVIGQPEDSYGGIFQKDEQLAQLMKRRGGVGIDISTLRPDGAGVSNAAGTSTGAYSFMHRYSNTTREVAQKGRRGALMITLDVRHPDITEFVNIKRDLTQVTGANISIMNRDEFMESVEKNEDYLLSFPCTSQQDLAYIPLDSIPYDVLIELKPNFFVKKIKAKKLFDDLVESNWLSGEPGNIYIDRHWDYSPDGVYPQYKGVTTNPCGEVFMGVYDACRLMCLNFLSVVINPFKEDAIIDLDKLYCIAYDMQTLADDLVDLEIDHIDAILKKIDLDPSSELTKRTERELWQNIRRVASSGRRTGCGFTALGDMLAAIGVKYASEDGNRIVDVVMRTKMEAELDATIDMAITRGSFDGWSKDLEFPYEQTSYEDKGGNSFFTTLLSEFFPQALRMMKYGRRNVSWSTVAPTGTVSIMTQSTGGIEPLFAPYYMRRRKVNPSDDHRVDFIDANGDKWMEFGVLHPQFKKWICGDTGYNTDGLTNDELSLLFEKSPWFGSIANDIDWHDRIKIQSIVQKYTTHSISSTVNLPKDVDQKVISNIYMEAWKSGLKGITVYRDTSRTGVLVNDKKEAFRKIDPSVRPDVLKAEYHPVMVNGKEFAVLVGLMEGYPYEVFAFAGTVFHEFCEGEIVKITKEEGNSYTFKSPRYNIEDLQLGAEHAEEELTTRYVSGLLRHGADPKYIVDQINKTPLAITSFGKALARVIKRFIPDGEEVSNACPSCGEKTLRYEEGCKKCPCGFSAC